MGASPVYKAYYSFMLYPAYFNVVDGQSETLHNFFDVTFYVKFSERKYLGGS